MTQLHIENYKGLRDIHIPLSQFACLIGENNAGKSSVLQGLALFFSGTTLPKTTYFDDFRNVRIEVLFSDIVDSDINRLAEEHRERIRQIVNTGSLTLVRAYGKDGKSSLKYRKLVPTQDRFSDENIAFLVKGKKGKPLLEAVTGQFPEIKDQLTSSMTQAEMKARYRNWLTAFP